MRFAVFSDSTSSRAISRLDSPRLISHSTSRSRVVSGSRWVTECITDPVWRSVLQGVADRFVGHLEHLAPDLPRIAAAPTP